MTVILIASVAWLIVLGFVWSLCAAAAAGDAVAGDGVTEQRYCACGEPATWIDEHTRECIDCVLKRVVEDTETELTGRERGLAGSDARRANGVRPPRP